MKTDQFITNIFISHTKDQTVLQHSETTVTAIVGILQALARNSDPDTNEKLSNIHNELVNEFEKFKTKWEK